ncbi:MAG: triple tyrosine motif-containing protein, partial [Mycoplasmatales bacterium]
MASSGKHKKNTMPKLTLKFIVVFLFYFIATNQVFGVNNSTIILQSQSYGVAQGLSQSTVTSIVEDRDGYIWIGTFNGLNRFDGKSFKHFYSNGNNSSLPSSFIRSLLIDEHGILLVGTDKGLVMYDKFTESFTPYSQLVKDAPIWSLNSSESGILVGTNDTIFEINSNTQNYKFKSNTLSDIKKIIKVNNGYYVKDYSGKLFEIKDKKLNVVAKQVIDFEGDDLKSIYISLNDGVYKYDGNIEKTNNSNIEKLNNFSNSIYGISKEHIINISNGEVIGKLTSENISTFIVTNDMYIVGTIDKGIVIISKAKNLIKNTKISSENTWQLVKLSDGFLVSSDSNLVKQFDSHFEIKKVFDTKHYGYKYSIINNNILYTGTKSGLYYQKNGSIIKIQDTPISSLAGDENTEYVLAGTTNGKILIIKEQNVINTIETKTNEPIFDIELGSENTIYIAGQSGLKKYKDNKLSDLNDEITYSIEKGDDGFYFGTSTSLMFINKKTDAISKIFSNNKEIYSIVNSNNYITTSSLSEVNIYKKDGKHVYTLKTANGSQHEYNSPSGINVNENILLPGLNGISLISLKDVVDDIESIKTNKVIISNVSVFNISQDKGSHYFSKSTPFENHIKLKYSDYPFSFTFISPMSDEASIKYFYRMVGLSDNWISSNGINSATYTNLSPGEYTFQVYSTNLLSQDSSGIEEVNVTITPPWWLSTKAKILYAIIIFTFLLTFFRSILRRRKTQKQIALSEERLKLSLWGSGDEMWDWDIETGNIFRSNIWGALEFPKDGQRAGKSGEESNIHPMDQERVREALNKHFYRETDHFEAAYRVKGKDDNWVWI